MFTSLPPLRTLLLVDAASCTAMGLALALGAGAIGSLTRIPAAILLSAGLVLLPIAAFMAAVALRPSVSRGGARLVVLGNAGWVAGSLLLPVGGWIAPNGLGIAFLLAQALAVAVLAALEAGALRAQAAPLRTS